MGLFFKFYFLNFFLYVFCVYVYVYHKHACCPQSQEEGSGSQDLEVQIVVRLTWLLETDECWGIPPVLAFGFVTCMQCGQLWSRGWKRFSSLHCAVQSHCLRMVESASILFYLNSFSKNSSLQIFIVLIMCMCEHALVWGSPWVQLTTKTSPSQDLDIEVFVSHSMHAGKKICVLHQISTYSYTVNHFSNHQFYKFLIKFYAQRKTLNMLSY